MTEGVSLFLAIPESRWLAANDAAFAISDLHPVAQGHALVIPRRVITTWWETTDQERSDILALVDEVKELLEARFRPDGYNIGINIGEAAGQTVGHLHVHVIPRHRATCRTRAVACAMSSPAAEPTWRLRRHPSW